MDQNYTKITKCGLRLKECRKSKGFSQERLAELSNYSIQTVSYIENGKRNMTRDAAHAFAKILGIREEYLLCEDDSKTREELFALESFRTYKNEGIEKALHSVGCWEYITYGDVVEQLEKSELVNIEKIILSISDNQFITCSEASYCDLINDIREYIVFRLNQFAKKCSLSTNEEITQFKNYYFWDSEDI